MRSSITKCDLNAEIADTLPSDPLSLMTAAKEAIVRLNDAVLASHKERADEAAMIYSAAIWKKNGGTHFASHASESAAGRVIENYCAAVPGIVPMWGQQGCFLLEVRGIRSRVKFSFNFTATYTCGFEFHAVDIDGPFISETGYRSCYMLLTFGKTVLELAEYVFTKHLDSGRVYIKNEYHKRLKAEANPEWIPLLASHEKRINEIKSEVLPVGYRRVFGEVSEHQAFIVKKWTNIKGHSKLAVLIKNAKFSTRPGNDSSTVSVLVDAVLTEHQAFQFDKWSLLRKQVGNKSESSKDISLKKVIAA